MSQALYRQYRPQRFDDVVGQPIALRTLRNAIEQDRVAHAYLFTGTKGTGKTTLAKLLAKAMNCVNGPTVDPCGTCDECVAIAEGRSLDVLELDAASHTGIDDVREMIIDTVAFQPTRGTRRVYIIDEAHQLSKHAFNALLKTIEEPPAHVIFVFCTTEAHLMMSTIRDRCQRITMRSPGPELLEQVLAKVCEREQITADEQALRAVARSAQGSFRNALGTLEMLATTLGPSFTREEVLQHLGVVSEEVLFEVADAVIDAQVGAVLGAIERLAQDGVDLDQFARSLAEHLRGVLLQMHGQGVHAVTGDASRLAAQAERADERRVLAAIDCIADAATRMRIGSDPRICVETALVRACQGLGLPLLALRIAALEQGAAGSYGQPIGSAAPAPAPPPAVSAKPAAPAPAPAPGPELSDEDLGNVQSWWPQVVQRVAKNPAHRPMLQELAPQSASATKLVLQQAKVVLVSPMLRQALHEATFEVTGRKLAVELLEPVAAATAPAPSATPTPTPAAPPAAVPVTAPAAAPTPDEGIETLMTMFDATPVLDDETGDGER